MTAVANRFQVTGVIRPAFRQFQDVMAMGLDILCRLLAVLTDALVPLENILLQGQPQGQWHPSVPGKS